MLFLLPAIIITIVGIAMGGYSDQSFVVGVLDRARTTESRALVARLASNEQFRIRDYSDEQKLRLAVFRGRMNAGLVIPSGWRGHEDVPVYLTAASAGAAVVRAEIESELSAMASGQQAPQVPVSYPAGGHGGAPRLGFAYTAPANLVLFVMINGFVSALAVIRLRQSGISRRLLATPRRTWELYALLGVGPFQQMVAQAVFLILMTQIFFGVHWGDIGGTILITATLACFGVSLVLFMGTIFRSPEQATSLGPWIGVAVGMLGGCMWPLEVVPPVMRTLAHLSPAAWAMDGYLALIFDHASAAEVAPDAAVVFLFAIALAVAGIIRLRPQLSR